ncbi:MAG: AbrB/MazE/SpoVT family DNA-binding domain-containing protein, partial [Candidatus Bathyarchaeia archaeon]
LERLIYNYASLVSVVRVKITRNYQITIPAQVRDELGLKEGEELEVRLDEGGRIIVERLPKGRRVLKAGRRLSPEDIEELIERGLAESAR